MQLDSEAGKGLGARESKDESEKVSESQRWGNESQRKPERERQRQSHPELAREPEKMSVIASKNLRDVVRESRSERYSSYTDVWDTFLKIKEMKNWT